MNSRELMERSILPQENAVIFFCLKKKIQTKQTVNIHGGEVYVPPRFGLL